jgi:peptidoglycan hydrolase-like protein with peptidoglycan-binding domain
MVGGVEEGTGCVNALIHDTKWIQSSLNAVYGAGLDVDGNFGTATQCAVIAFQLDHGLKPDGIVGPLTIAALLSALQLPA